MVGTAEVCVAESITARSTVLFNGMTIDNKYYVTGIRNSLKPDVQMRVSIM